MLTQGRESLAEDLWQEESPTRSCSSRSRGQTEGRRLGDYLIFFCDIFLFHQLTPYSLTTIEYAQLDCVGE